MQYDSDLDLILADAGNTLTVGQVTAPCEFSSSDQILGASEAEPGQIANLTYVLVRASAVPQVPTDSSLQINTADGQTLQFRAAQVHLIQEGRVMQIFLGESDGDF